MTLPTPDEQRIINRIAERVAIETRLSETEAAVLVCDEAGIDTSVIGRLIGRSNGTVDRHRANIRRKLRDGPAEIDALQAARDHLAELGPQTGA